VRRNGAVEAVGDWSPFRLPPTVKALLAARLDRLESDERAVLERGSVEGKVFHRSAVLELSAKADQPRLDRAMRELARASLIHPAKADFANDTALGFHHQLLRDVAYESLPKAARAEHHERFADWLEQKSIGRDEEFEEIMAHHLQEAYRYRADLGPIDDHGRALAARAGERLGSAGLRAYARGDFWGASKLLTSAVALLPSERGLRLGPQLDDARFETGERTPARMSWASLRCFWRQPRGHSWEFRQRGSESMRRCASCGKVRRYRGALGHADEHTLTAAGNAGFLLESRGRGPDGGE
jgi:hypothetical protein